MRNETVRYGLRVKYSVSIKDTVLILDNFSQTFKKVFCFLFLCRAKIPGKLLKGWRAAKKISTVCNLPECSDAGAASKKHENDKIVKRKNNGSFSSFKIVDKT